ncbi:hypothetical protein I4U23_022595 [Adineta vaga]|nr:hypothetical protein I4U23_022595 [Adineta vaga]
MGNRLGTSSKTIRATPVPIQDLWLQNQTFRIRDHLYTLIQRRGGGTFGSVWASSDVNGNYVAVKVFDLNRFRQNVTTQEILKSFKDENEIICQIRNVHQYIIEVYGYDFDAHRNVILVSMELANESLTNRVQYLHENISKSNLLRNDFISAKDRKDLWIQLVNILLVLHQFNIVHRDLKPDSFVLVGSVLKLIDLGIATKEISKLTSHYTGRRRITVGTRYFSGPECLTGQYSVTTKADIWSIGAILYYLTYGIPPIYESAQHPIGHFKTDSSLVENILQSCLIKNPNRRASHQWLLKHPLTNTNVLL